LTKYIVQTKFILDLSEVVIDQVKTFIMDLVGANAGVMHRVMQMLRGVVERSERLYLWKYRSQEFMSHRTISEIFKLLKRGMIC